MTDQRWDFNGIEKSSAELNAETVATLATTVALDTAASHMRGVEDQVSGMFS